MSIITKGGDKGQTSLYSAQRVHKTDTRVEAYGTLDELDGFIGLARSHIEDEEMAATLLKIQNTLYRIMGELATVGEAYIAPIGEKEVEELTELVKEYEKGISLDGFVIPGARKDSAYLDLCRSVARRGERRVLSLSLIEELSPYIIKYLNRLSDLMFIMARHLEKGKSIYKDKV